MKDLAAVFLAAMMVIGCIQASADASREQLAAALRECGIRTVDIRPGRPGETAWVWYWHHDSRVNNSTMNCVRDELGSQNLEATFIDASIADVQT